jgi:hypothetical protein
MIQTPAPSASLTTEFEYILRLYSSLAASIVGLFDLYLCL